MEDSHSFFQRTSVLQLAGARLRDRTGRGRRVRHSTGLQSAHHLLAEVREQTKEPLVGRMVVRSSGKPAVPMGPTNSSVYAPT